MNKLMKRLLVVAVFVLAIVGMTVLCASAAETTGYETDEAALAADSTFAARVGAEGTSATYYTTLKAAVNAVADNGTVYVIRDYTVTAKLNMTKKVTIRSASDNENERFTLTVSINHMIDTDDNSASSEFTFDYININAGAHNLSYLNKETLVIGKNAYVYGSGSSSYGLLYADNNGAQIIVDGKVEVTSGSNIAIYAKKNCKVKVNGTVSRAANGNLFNLIDSATLEVLGGTYSSTGGNMFYLNGTGVQVGIGGGSFTYTTDNSAEFIRVEKITQLVIDGGTFTRSGGDGDNGGFIYYVDAKDNGITTVLSAPTLSECPVVLHSAVTFGNDTAASFFGYVTRVGAPADWEDGYASSNYYKTINDAVAALKAHGSEVVLIKSYTQSGAITKGSNYTYTLSSIDNVNIMLTVGGSYLFDIGAGNSNYVTLTNIKINVGSKNLGYFSNPNGIVIDAGTHIYGAGKSASEGLIFAQNNSSKITVMAGATIEATGAYPIFGITSGDVVIEGGTLEGRRIALVSGSSKFTLSGGTINFKGTDSGSDRAIYANSATASITISGGTINALNATASNMIRADGPFTMTGGTFNVTAAGNNPLRIANTATITGGTINNSTDFQTIYVTTSGTLTVSGLTHNGPFLNQDGTAVVTVNSGTYANAVDANTFYMNGASSTLTIAGGSFTHTNTSATNMIQVMTGALNISGGTFVYYGTGDGTNNNNTLNNGAIVRYKTSTTKIHMTGGMMIHEGAGAGFIFFRQDGALILDGENVALIARGTNYVFEQAYQDNVSNFNGTTSLIIKNGVYLSSVRAELVFADPGYYDFTNVTLDSDAVAGTLKGGSTYYFLARLGDVSRTIVIPATTNTAEQTKTVYGGYYTTYAKAIAAAPTDGTATSLYFTRSTVARIGSTTIAAGQNIVLKSNVGTITINGSNATYFLSSAAGSALTLSGINIIGCPTQFISCAGNFTMTDGATMTLEANDSTSETSPIINLSGGAVFTMDEGTSIQTVYPDGERVEGEPSYIKNPHVINMASGFTGIVDVAGTIVHNWDTRDDWGPIFRIRGNATIIIRSTAVLTLNTTVAAADGQAMFLNGDAAASNLGTVTVEAGAQLTSTTYPLFYGNINFNNLQSALNAGMVARLGDTLQASIYYKTLLAAISAVPANDTVVTIITNTSTTTIYSPASGNYKAGQNGTQYSFVLSAINGAVLTSSSAWLFDLGSGASVVPTLRDITVNLGSKNFGYLNNVDVVIDDGAYIYGTGSSATNGMFYCLNGTVITVKEGAKIELISGAFPMFALEGKSAVNATSAELVYSGTDYVFYGNGSGTSTITGTDIDVSAGGLATVLTSKTNSFTFTNCEIDATISQAGVDFVAIVGTGAAVTFAGGDIDVTATYSTGNNPIMTSAGTLTFDGGDIDFTTNAMDLIHNTGTFVIKGTTDLSITGGGDGIENKATFIMSGGTITSSGLALYNNNAKAYITGGTINGTYTHNAAASTFTYIVGSTASFAKATSASVYRDVAAAVNAGYVAYTAAAIDAGFTAVEFPAAAGGATYNVRNDYCTTLDAAAKLVSAEKSVIVLIADFTQSDDSMTTPAASFTLTSINNAVLTVKTSWLFDLGDGSAIVPTIKNIEIVIPSGYNLGYFNNVSAIIDMGAYIHGVGASGKGLIYGYAGFDLTVKDGAKIVVDSGSNTGIYAQTSSTINIEGGEFIYNSTGHNILSIYSSSILNITGGTFTYNSGANAIVYVNAATANISGGTFVSYGAAGSSIVRYAATTSKVHVTGSPVLIHEGSGVGYVFYRDNGNLVIEGEGVKLIARGENYLFEQAYQDAIADFNNTNKLIITGAYLSTERADGVMVQNDPSYYTFSNVTLDFDNAQQGDKRQPASVLHGGTYYYFAARIDNGDSAREIVLPATKAYPEGRTLTVYGGYYTTFDAAWKAATGNDFDIYATKDQTGIARATYVINGNVTLYLNGHTVAAAEANDVLFNVKAGATLTILNGTITCSNRFAYAYGTLNLGDAEGATGTLTITDPGKITTHMFYVIGAGNLNVYKNATLKTTSTASIGAALNYVQMESSFTGTVNVYGTIELNLAVTGGTTKMFRVTSGTATGSVNVYDGAVLTYNCNCTSASNEHAMFYNYDQAGATYNIYGGTIKNTAGKGVLFFLYKGIVNIEGGNLESNGAYGIYAYGSPTINISGGTFNSKSASSINVYAKDTANVSVTGGTFIAESTVNTYNVYFNQTTALTIKDATFIHNGTGSNLAISNSTNNVTIAGNTQIIHNGTASTSNVALNRGGGKYIYVDGTDANLVISAPNGAYILRTAYYVEFKNCSVLGSCATLGSVSGEDKYGQFNNVIVPADMVDNWMIAVAVSDGTTTWAYSKVNTTSLDSTYFGYAVAKLTAMEATDVTLYFGENLTLARLTDGYNFPAGKNITINGYGKSISVNGSNAQILFNVPATTTLTTTNVTFTACPTKFAYVAGDLTLGDGTTINVYANSSTSEGSPLVIMTGDSTIVMEEGATILFDNSDSGAENPVAGYATAIHVFATTEYKGSLIENTWYGSLTIKGSITYNITTSGQSAIVYVNHLSSGKVTVESSATLVYGGESTAESNGYFVINGASDMKIAQSVFDALTATDDYAKIVGIEVALSDGYYVTNVTSDHLFKLTSPGSAAYYATPAAAYAAMTSTKTQYTLFVLGNYTFKDSDRKTFSGAYYLTVVGLNENVTITETVGGYMWVIKAGAQLTFRNIKIVTNGAVVQVDAGSTNTYLTLAKGTKIIGSGKLSGTTFFDLWNAANFTLEHGAEIDTTGTSASGQVQLIHAQNSCQKPINIAGKITHGTSGNYNHKILRTSSSPSQGATLVINILGTAELIYNCPDIAANNKEGAIIHNYPGDLYNTNFQINVYDGAKLQHNKNGAIFYFASYGTKREVNIYGGTFEVNGGASFAHLTCGSTMNLMGGTIKITNGDYLFGGDQTGTYTVSGNVTMDLANVKLFQVGATYFAIEEVHFNGSNITLILGENVTTAAANADTRYVVHNASQFADDATAALFLASYRTGGAYYTDLKTVIGATTAEDNTVYVVRDDANGKRVTGGIAITGKSVIIDGLGHSMNVNGANEQFLFVIAADGALTLKDVTLTNCPTKLASVAGALTLQNADVVLYTMVDNEAIVNETSPLVYLTGAATFAMDEASTINFTYADGDDREFVDNQANIYVFHTASDWTGAMNVDGTVIMGWNVEGRFPIFYLESTAGKITLAKTAVVKQTGTASAAGTALVMAAENGATEFYIYKGADVSTTTGIMRLGNVTPMTGEAAEKLGYGDAVIVSITISWGAMTFDYTEPTWNTDTLRWEGYGFTPTAEGADQITFQNTGTVAIATNFTFTPNVGFEEITATYKSGDADAQGMEIEGNSDPVAVTILPTGLIPFNQSGQLTLGTLTISLTEGGNS